MKVSLDTRIAAAEIMIRSYVANIEQFESGAATPDVGELMANRMLLSRKRKQLVKLKGERAIRNMHTRSQTQVIAA